MKQVLQSLADGRTEVVEVPCPQLRPGHVLIASHLSLISAGTERMILQFGSSSLLSKARQQPDKVRMVIEKLRTDGLWSTLERVRSKLDQPIPMGYSNVGTVIEVGDGVTELSPGDRVVSNGPHAELVCVPRNLCARVPDGVPDEEAVFTVLGAIALQGIRLAKPTLGESFAVIGLGPVGLLAAQLLRAHGCRVIGFDLKAERIELARQFGVETVDASQCGDPVQAALKFSRGRGVDGVLVATSTASRDPIHHAALMSRKRGRVILVGVAGLQLSRTDFYEKELTFRVSCSYGPGRYDPRYEAGGEDYPLSYVRWTEQRNFEAVLDMLADRKISAAKLITHRFPIERAPAAYELINSPAESLGVILEHDGASTQHRARLHSTRIRLQISSNAAVGDGRVVVGLIGAGNFARGVLIPAFKKSGARLLCIASIGGVTGIHAARRHEIAESTTDARQIIADPRINAVVIATRHDSHADFVCDALRAGKHVYVEKPLAVDADQLDRIVGTQLMHGQSGRRPICMVGFNRRFAPHIRKMHELLARQSEPKTFIMTVNAGAIPLDHWTQDRRIGGGRIIGEGCHFIDLLRFLCGHDIVGVQAATVGGMSVPAACEDKMTFTLQFADGSLGTVHYFANGSRTYPKERLEVFCAGHILQLNNYRSLYGFGCPGFRKLTLWRQDRGHQAAVAEFVDAVRCGRPSPVPFEDAVEVTRTSLEIVSLAGRRNAALRSNDPAQRARAEGGEPPSDVDPLLRSA